MPMHMEPYTVTISIIDALLDGHNNNLEQRDSRKTEVNPVVQEELSRASWVGQII